MYRVLVRAAVIHAALSCLQDFKQINKQNQDDDSLRKIQPTSGHMLTANILKTNSSTEEKGVGSADSSRCLENECGKAGQKGEDGEFRRGLLVLDPGGFSRRGCLLPETHSGHDINQRMLFKKQFKKKMHPVPFQSPN